MVTACDDGPPPNPVREVLAQAPPAPEKHTSLAIRFTERNEIQVYRLPGLVRAPWKFTDGVTVSRVVGYSPARDAVFLLTRDSALVALEIDVGRTRIVDSNVVAAAIGPLGVPMVVTADGLTGRMENGKLNLGTDTLPTLPDSVWAGVGDRLIGLADNGSKLIVSSSRQTGTRDLPYGGKAFAPWGDLGVIAVDSGLVLIDPRGRHPDRFMPLDVVPAVAAVSTAGHRIYAVSSEGLLLFIDRFDLVLLDTLQLPARANRLRTDPLGRVLLAGAEDGSTTWVVGLVTRKVIAEVDGTWSEDTPVVATDGTILTRAGADLVAHHPPDYRTTSRLRRGASGTWLTVPWRERQTLAQLAGDTTEVPALPGQQFYVQVASTSNESWARDLANKLAAAGMEASVMQPEFFDDPYRVVLGPYETREEADDIGRKLGRSFWIFTREAALPDSL